jgi:cell division protein FtsQ
LTNSIKIKSVLLLTTLLVVVFSISLITNSSKDEKIAEIKVVGNYHLSTDEYLKFAHIDKNDSYLYLTPRIIKDRLEKHPYIAGVDILLDKTELKIILTEKVFESLIMFDGIEYLVSDKLVIIPRLEKSLNIDYPIISNPLNAKNIKEFEIASNNEDVKVGLKIMTALKIINSNLFSNLSEINLRNGKDILLQFSKIDAPIILGRNNEIAKIMYLKKLVQKFDQVNINNVVDYIDLRYSNYIYVGKSENNSIQESVI